MLPPRYVSSSILILRSRADSDHLQGFVPRELVPNEVNWFYSQLGIDDTYFRNETVESISDHIIALFGAKVLAYTKHDPSKLAIDLEKIDDNGAVFIHSSTPGETATEGPGSNCESRSVPRSLVFASYIEHLTGLMLFSWTRLEKRLIV